MGLAVLVWALASTERRRSGAVARVALGTDSTQVVRQLGAPPARCRTGTLRTVRNHLPPDLAPAAEQVTVDRIVGATAERWVYPLRRRGAADPCAMSTGTSEIGMDREGKVLWIVPSTGRTPLLVSDEYFPQGGDAST